MTVITRRTANNLLLVLLLVLFLIPILFISVPSLQASNATFVYITNGTAGSCASNLYNCPRIREWDSATNAMGAEVELPTSTSPIEFTLLKYSPVSTKRVLVTVSDSGVLSGYVCYKNCGNETSWTVTTNFSQATMGRQNRFTFDFETATGHALVVYDPMNTTVNCDLAYKILPANSTTFSGLKENCINDNTTTADMNYTWLASARNTSFTSRDIIVAGFESTGADVNVWVWNVTNQSFSAQKEISATASQFSGNRGFDVKYAGDNSLALVMSGDAINGNIEAFKWDGLAWGNTTFGDIDSGDLLDVRWLILKADPATDDMVATVVDNGNDLHSFNWTGSVWGNRSNIDLATDVIAQGPGADYFWHPTNSSGWLVWDTDTTGITLNVTACQGGCGFGFGLIRELRIYRGTGRWITAYENPSANESIQAFLVRMNNTGDLSFFNWTGLNFSTAQFSSSALGNGTRNDNQNSWSVAFQLNQTALDVTGPVWSAPTTNDSSVKQNEAVLFNTSWTDDLNLKGYFFSINQSGTWINSSFVTFAGESNVSENTTLITAAADFIVQWRFYANDSTDKVNVTSIQEFTVQSGNTAPVVSAIYYANATQSITESGVTNLTLSFLATDVDGVGNLNDTTAGVNTTIPGHPSRANNSCGLVSDINSSTANYSCVVPIHYFDLSGNWTITAFVSDTNGLMAQNTSNFTLASTLAVTVGPSSLTFASISPSATNTTASNDPVTVNNTGNSNITTGNVRVQAITLIGATNANFNISASNFTVDVVTGAGNPECGNQTVMSNASTTSIIDSILPRGNNSVGVGPGAGVEQLYVCLRNAPAADVLPAQTYSATGGAAWTISVI